jgi:antitoxin component HigA of HigAB toxin-antitoxin module
MRDLKPIRSEKDYERGLAEVEELWGEKSGTPKGDRMDILATLIEGTRRSTTRWIRLTPSRRSSFI